MIYGWRNKKIMNDKKKEEERAIQDLNPLFGEVKEVKVHEIVGQGEFKHHIPEGMTENEKKNYQIMMDMLGIK